MLEQAASDGRDGGLRDPCGDIGVAKCQERADSDGGDVDDGRDQQARCLVRNEVVIRHVPDDQRRN